MAKAYVYTKQVWAWPGLRRTVILEVVDSHGRQIVTDNTGYSRDTWLRFIEMGAEMVQALRVLERSGHRTQYTWGELVDRARI